MFLHGHNRAACRLSTAPLRPCCAVRGARRYMPLYRPMIRDLLNRLHNPGPIEFTWYSTLKGGMLSNGFRLDHAFATPPLWPRNSACRYSHREREAGISDHSVVIVEVAQHSQFLAVAQKPCAASPRPLWSSIAGGGAIATEIGCVARARSHLSTTASTFPRS